MAQIQFREAIAQAIMEEMRLDSSVFLMGEEVAPRREFIVTQAKFVANLDI